MVVEPVLLVEREHLAQPVDDARRADRPDDECRRCVDRTHDPTRRDKVVEVADVVAVQVGEQHGVHGGRSDARRHEAHDAASPTVNDDVRSGGLNERRRTGTVRIGDRAPRANQGDLHDPRTIVPRAMVLERRCRVRSVATVVDVLVDAAVYVDGVRVDPSDPRPGFTWIGFDEPTRDELRPIADRFGFNVHAVDDAVTTHQRPKLEIYDDHVFIVIRTIAYRGPRLRLDIGDLCLFVAESAVVTARHGEAMPLTTVRSDLQGDPRRLMFGPMAVVHAILDRLVDQYLQVGDLIAADVRALEDSVFDDDVPAAPQELYAVKRELIDFQRAAEPFLEPLTRIAEGGLVGINGRLRFDFADVRDHLLRVLDHVRALDRTMDAAMQANLSLLALKQNEDMRRISAWVGMAAVPTMVAGIYGMNFDNMPELRTEWGYFAVVGAMAVAVAGLYWLFRRRKWL